MSTISVQGTQVSSDSKGMAQLLDAIRSDKSGNTAANGGLAITASSKGHVTMELFDENGASVASHSPKGTLASAFQLFPVANSGAEGDAGTGGSSFRWNVSPDNFSSGRLEMTISGRLQDTSLACDTGSVSEIAYKGTINGNGYLVVSIPFTVTP